MHRTRSGDNARADGAVGALLIGASQEERLGGMVGMGAIALV
jgi:hypothetical protein